MSTIPQEDAVRKEAPMYRGLFGYFPYALFAVAAHSNACDKKHNPYRTDGPHWNRTTSNDHLDALLRHVTELHSNEDYHLAAIAWRALAALQERGEELGFTEGSSSKR